jgi:hypothetical protein
MRERGDGLLYAGGIYQALKAAFEFEAEIGFRAYVRERHATKWVIAADFVTSGPERINDTFAFTIYPYEQDSFSELLSDNRTAMPADIKRVKHLHPNAPAFLADRRRFHFCFVPDKERHQLGSWENAQAALAGVANHVRGLPESPSKPHYIQKFDALIQRAKKTKFNYVLLHDITLLATLSAYIALLLAKHSRPEMIMWAFDRDAMTTAFNGIVYDMAYLNFHSACEMERVQNNRVLVSSAIDSTARNGQSAWFDDLIRAPDHIAGAIARWDFWADQDAPVSPKVAEVIESAIAENPNLIILAIRCSVFGISCSRVRTFSRANTNRAAYDHRPGDLVDYLVSTALRQGQIGHTTYRRGISDTSAINNIGLRVWWRPVCRPSTG